MSKIVLILIALWPMAQVQAFTLNSTSEIKFQDRSIPIDVANMDCSKTGLTAQEILDLAVHAADETWNGVGSADIEFVPGEIVDVDQATFATTTLCTAESYLSADAGCTANPLLYRDQGILIVCNENTVDFPTNTTVLAATIPVQVKLHIKSSLIFLNNSGTLNSNPIGQLDRAQQKALLAHEIGHAFGLGHSVQEESLMYYSLIGQRRHLGEDDIDGITYLYPNRDRPLGVGCDPLLLGTSPPNQTGPPSPPGNASPVLSFFLGLLAVAIIAKALRPALEACR